MKLYVFRHGMALSLSEAKVHEDADRPLADMGREDVRAMAQFIQAMKAPIEVILSSPLKRAKETAEIAAKVLQPKSGVQFFEPLSNRMPGPMLFKALQENGPRAAEFIVVGHQPQLGEMVEHLIGRGLDIRPGGVVALDVGKNGKAVFLWNKNP